MLRFFALAWDGYDASHSAVARNVTHALAASQDGWRAAYEGNGLRVFCTGTELSPFSVSTLCDGAGVVVGPIFGRDSEPERAPGRRVFEAADCSAIVSSCGRVLVDRYWGSYVAFLMGPDSKRWVLRAPRGFLPCFMAVHQGVTFYFSHVEDCAALDLISFTVDWKTIALSAVYGSAGPIGSSINEISEIRPGECVELQRAESTRAVYWHPADVARSAIIDDPVEASQQMRSTLKRCVHQWASAHEGIVHKLSGGIDSSVVLGCLQDAPTRPTLIATTDYCDGPDSDERHYARLAAQRAGCELVERRRDPALSYEQALSAGRTAVPSAYHLELITDRPAVELARRRGCTAIFSGVQGDAIFHRHPAMPAAAEYIHHHGIRSSVFRVAWDSAYLERTSVWKVLRDAFAHKFGRSRHSYWAIRRGMMECSNARTLVNAGVAEQLYGDESLIDPWLRRIEGVPPGKVWQIFALTVGTSYNDPFATPDDPEPVHPLVSQPLAEVCLRIPTYLHVYNGWDRAIARRAFAPDVPREILLRTTKGGMSGYTKDLVRRNNELIRDLLLDGALVREGLLKRDLLADALSERPTRTSVTSSDLMRYFSIEVWLRLWASRKSRSARQRAYCPDFSAAESS